MKSDIKTRRIFSVALTALALACGSIACGSTPAPKELLDARAALTKAQTGPAAQNSPAQIHVAKESLDAAEKAFEKEPDTQETRDRAYVALRQAELADAQGRLAAAEEDRNRAQKEFNVTQGSQLKSTKKQLEQEKHARVDAEKRAKEALVELAKMAQIKEESRGMVITLSGQVLFASGKSTLLPAALSSLDNVATALKSTPDRSVVVEGHTDSQGPRGFNMDLSTKRAQSVRDYIVSKGVASDAARAVGIGPDRAVADNGTAEGRANNRRVEIIVSPAGEHK